MADADQMGEQLDAPVLQERESLSSQDRRNTTGNAVLEPQRLAPCRAAHRPNLCDPESAYPFGDGFVLSVAYPKVDWCENVLAARRCTLTWNGKEYALENPEVIPAAEAMKAYPLLVKPFLAAQAPETKKFIWLHRSNSQEPQSL